MIEGTVETEIKLNGDIGSPILIEGSVITSVTLNGIVSEEN